MATQIPNNVAKRAIFVQEFKSVLETRNIWSKVATKIIATAKNIYSPFTSVNAAKAHTQACVTPVSPLTVNYDELILDRKIGNAIKDCKEELSYANFDIQEMIRADLYASVMKKANEVATDDFLADATTGTTIDLSSTDKIREYLVGVKAKYASASVGLSQTIDGGRIVRAENHNKPFVAASTSVFVKILSAIGGEMSLSTTAGIQGRIIETPYGVTLINLEGTEDVSTRIIEGLGGVPTMAYREDQINVDMGEVTSFGTYSSSTADLDLTQGDEIISKQWYILAETKGRNGIFSNVAPLVVKHTATLA